MPDPVSRDVGRRLRSVRRQQGLSLEEVEERSGGKWSASAIGAYERGYRTLSIERLRELSEFYSVPISILLAPQPKRTGREPLKVVVDLDALNKAGRELEPVARLVRSIQIERNDFNGKMISIRQSDIRSLALVYGVRETDLIDKLAEKRVLVEGLSDPFVSETD